MLDSRDYKNDYLEYFVNTLNQFSLKKIKIFWENHKLHINKTPPKAIKKRL